MIHPIFEPFLKAISTPQRPHKFEPYDSAPTQCMVCGCKRDDKRHDDKGTSPSSDSGAKP